MSDAGPWLLLDVGNSAIKWRLASASGLFSEGGRADDVATLSAMLEGRDWYRVAIASVAADSRDTTLAEVASAGRPVEVHYATADAELLGLRNRYPAPQSLGVDRWLAMLAAWHHLGGPLCVVDRAQQSRWTSSRETACTRAVLFCQVPNSCTGHWE